MPKTLFFPAWRHQLGPMRSPKPLSQELRRATLAQIENRLAPALPGPLLDKPKAHHYSRERIFPLFRTFWCWIWQILQANTSCREVVRQVQALFALEQAGSVDEATGAYCQARSKMPLTLLEKVFQTTAKSAEQKAPPAEGLQGRRTHVLDGSSVRLADTPTNRKNYPPPKNVAAGCGFPVLKIVVLFSLLSGALLARATGNQYTHEVRICEALRPFFVKGDIMIADRAYALFSVLAWLQNLGLDVIARVPTRLRRVDFRKAKKRYRTGEGLFAWQKPKACAFLPLSEWLGLASQITVRVLRVQSHQSGFRTQRLTLVTTLLDPVLYPAEEIIAAYARRWRLEMCLDDLKTTLGMENLRCRCPEMVQKELLVFFIAHNLLRWLMAEAAQSQEASLDRISFKGSLDAFRQWAQALAQLGKSKREAKSRARLWAILLQTLAADLVPERPGRREPRAVKRRSKYPHLRFPRKKHRDRPSRNKQRSRSLARKRAKLI
jgi:hypothetical protein